MTEQLNIINADQSWDNESNEDIIFNKLINDSINSLKTGTKIKNGSGTNNQSYDVDKLSTEYNYQNVNGDILGNPQTLTSSQNKNDDLTDYTNSPTITLKDANNDELYIKRKYKRYNGTASRLYIDDTTNEGRVVFKPHITQFSWESDGVVNAMTMTFQLNRNLTNSPYHTPLQLITPAISNIVFADSAHYTSNNTSLEVTPMSLAHVSDQSFPKGTIPAIPITFYTDSTEASVQLDANKFFMLSKALTNAPAICKVIVHDINFTSSMLTFKLSYRFFIVQEDLAQNTYAQNLKSYEISPIFHYSAGDCYLALNKFSFFNNDNNKIDKNEF